MIRGVARGGGGSWGARDPPLVGLLLSKEPTIFRWPKRHDNILAVKAIVEKPIFLICMIYILPSPSVTDSKYLILYMLKYYLVASVQESL